MIRLAQIRDCWNRFFFAPESPLPIAVYRILLGFGILLNQALMIPDVDDWYSEKGIVSEAVAVRLPGGSGLNLFRYLPNSDWVGWLIFVCSMLFGFTLMLGFRTRLSAVLSFLFLVSLHHRNTIVLNSGDTFLRLASFFIIFSQAGAALSVDRLIRIRSGKETGPPSPAAPWAMRLIQCQLAFVYFYAFIWKMMGPMWVSGTALYYTSRLQEFWRFPLPYIFEHMWTIKLWTWGTLVIEFALGVLVWVKELRYWVLAGGVLLHAGIDYTMNIPLFGFIMVSAYVLFVDPKDLERVIDAIKQKWFGQPSAALRTETLST